MAADVSRPLVVPEPAPPISVKSGKLTLENVVRLAVDRARTEDARADLAKRQLQYLQELDKPKWELRPVLNLFAISNPMLLATGLGASMPWNRRNAPGPVVLQGARFDALESEIAAETLKIRVVMDASRDYFQLLEKQTMSRQAQALFAQRTRRGGDLELLLAASRITLADKTTFEQELIDLEWQMVELEEQRRVAATRLGAWLGQTAADLEVSEEEPVNGRWNQPTAAASRLMTAAFANRAEPKLLREKIEALRKTRAKGSRVSVTAGQIDFGVSLPLKKNGEADALKEVDAARIRLLELELNRQEETIAVGVAELEAAAAANLEKMKLARRKLALAQNMVTTVQARVGSGLAPQMALLPVERSLLEAQWTQARADVARKSSVQALVAACGLNDQPAELQARLVLH